MELIATQGNTENTGRHANNIPLCTVSREEANKLKPQLQIYEQKPIHW